MSYSSHIMRRLKIHKHTSVNVVKTILNLIKQAKICKNVDINIIDKLIKIP